MTWRKWVVLGGIIVMATGVWPVAHAIENRAAAQSALFTSAYDDEDEDDLIVPANPAAPSPAADAPKGTPEKAEALPAPSVPAQPETPQTPPPADAQAKDAAAQTEIRPAAETQAPSKPNGLDYLSYFAADAYKTLREACVAWDPKPCLPVLEKARAKETDETQKIRLTFLYAQVLFEGRDFSRAKPPLEEVDGRYPLMQDYIHYYMGEILYWRHDYEKALERFDKVPEESRLKRLARIHATLAQAKLKRPEAKPALEALLEESKKHSSLPEILLALAEFDLQDDRELARKRLWRVMKEWPESSYSEQALERLGTAKLAPLTREEKIRLEVAKAKKLRKRFQYKQAAALLKGVLKDFDKGDRSLLKGTVLYHYARAYFENRDYQKAIDLYSQIEGTEATNYIKGLAVRDRVEAHIKRGENDQAIALARTLIDAQPTHRKICDVYALLGKAYKENKDFENALDTFNKLADSFPCSQKVQDALWYVGWLNYRKGRLDEAKKAFSAIIAANGDRFDRERAQYWLARIARKQGDRAGAVEQYRALVRMYPLTYYSILAAERLKRGGAGTPEEYKNRKNLSGLDILAEINGDMAQILAREPFKRGMELFRMGRVAEAKREFESMTEANPADEILTTSIAYMVQLSGDVSESVGLLRSLKRNYQRSYPGQGTRAAWALSYPMPYAPILDKYSKEYGVDKFLILALIREESSFDPGVMSYAHALGLTQIIQSTGKIIARKLKVKGFKFGDLKKPEVAIRFGSFHFRELTELFKGNHALAIAAYNAGEGAVKRWTGRAENLPMDVFIEEIPYSQTCKYTRRVLRSYGIYRFLYSDDEAGFNLWRNITRK